MPPLRRMLASMLLLVLAGCASTPEGSTDPLSAAPDDFSIDLAIVRGEDAPRRAESHLQAGRFILFSDGSLHYGEEANRQSDRLPPRARALSRAQMAGLWSMVQQLGFGDPAAGTEPVSFDLLPPPGDGMTYLIAFTANGQRWVFQRPAGAGEEPDAASAQLARRLARLAWASDLPERPSIVIPKRYDLGPDPYARYRQP